MDSYSKLLLELYRAAREMPSHEFPEIALVMLKSLLPFDSARMAVVELVGKGAIVHGAHLYNEPNDMMLDWEEISRHDTVLKTVVAQPGRSFSYDAPSLFTGVGRALMCDYAAQYGHQSGLVVAQYDNARGFWDGLSLYRARKDDGYSDLERRHIECLMPHMVEALTVNQVLSTRTTDFPPQAPDRGALAIARIDGVIHHCGPGFMKLMRLEWPEWRGHRLPDPVLSAFGRIKSSGFNGDCITIAVERAGELLFMRIRRIAPLDRLSPREREVAAIYGDGKSYKEIAREMGLAPATVRNFLQRIYQKLQISDKAELASMLIRSERSRPEWENQTGRTTNTDKHA